MSVSDLAPAAAEKRQRAVIARLFPINTIRTVRLAIITRYWVVCANLVDV